MKATTTRMTKLLRQIRNRQWHICRSRQMSHAARIKLFERELWEGWVSVSDGSETL